MDYNEGWLSSSGLFQTVLHWRCGMSAERFLIRISTFLLVPLLLLALLTPAAAAAKDRVFSVALALGSGGLGDKAFNDSAYDGLQNGKRELGMSFKVAEFRGADSQVGNLTELAQAGFDLIIAIGAENAAPLKEVAGRYPQQRFAIIDESVAAPNISSIVFRELEGDFLAGVLCALLSPNAIVGFIGAADIPVIRRIEHGWVQGVRYANPRALIRSEYIGGVNDFSAFRKPARAQELAMGLYAGGADILFVAAGGSTLGAIKAAEAADRLIVTTGSDSRWMDPKHVVTSRTKNMDAAVFLLLQELQDGTLAAGTRELDLAAGGVGLAPFTHERVSLEIKEKIDVTRRKLQAREIVPQRYQPAATP
jgi:basic membrane protein A